MILIGIIVLIFFGPRKLPEYAKKIGKVMADLRNTTNEFKTTWEREVNFEEEKKSLEMETIINEKEPPVAREKKILDPAATDAKLPTVRQIDAEEFAALRESVSLELDNSFEPDEDVSPDLSDKRSWL